MKHGTLTGYRTYRCRCEDCRAASAASMRRWRGRTGDSRSAARKAAIHEVAARWRAEHPQEWLDLVAAHQAVIDAKLAGMRQTEEEQ